MTQRQNDNFGSDETVNNYRNFLFSELTLLKAVLSRPLHNKVTQLKIVIATVCNTGSAIAELSKQPDLFHGEIVMLSRAFIEKTINFIYLTICDEIEFERFFKHTISKSIRKLDRKISITDKEIGIKFNGLDLNKLSETEKEALEAFTSKSGKEITHWTSVSLEKRIELISEKTEINIRLLMLNTLSIYEDASEALHGTFYGCSFFTWAYEPNIDRTNQTQVKENTNRKTTLILWQLGTMINEVICHLSKTNQIEEFKQASQKNVDKTVELMKAMINPQGEQNSG